MELFDTRLNADDKPLTAAELIEAVKTADVLVPTVTDRIDSRRALPGRAAAEADRLVRHRRRPHRPRHRPPARHHRHQHAGRADRGHRRHVDGAGAGHRAPHGRGRAAGARRQMDRLEPDLDAGRPAARASAWASSAWAASARRWRGARGASAWRSTITTASASMPRSSASSRRPTGRASTRCWRAWTSSRSTARTRRRPSICCRRGG